jgi:pimeloyl-ACP methyl ester carboxylesterase
MHPALVVSLATLLASLSAPLAAQPAPPVREAPPACVILLHGLGRTALSMMPMARALEGAGYVTANIDYPSRFHSIEVLAPMALGRGFGQCERSGATPVHVVTHSMGGILVRHYLSRHQPPALGRVVMLGPPNQGSAVADRLMDRPIYREVNGPAGQQLGTGPEGIAARLGPVDFPLGVLAGNERTAVDQWLSEGIEEDSDGKVTVEEAKVEGMADFRVLPANHTFIASDPGAIAQVIHFLREGRFAPEVVAPPPR